MGEHNTNVEVNYINKWLLKDPNLLHGRMSYLWESEKRHSVQCENCGKWLKTDERHQGEKKRIKRCSGCNEWFDVFGDVDNPQPLV